MFVWVCASLPPGVRPSVRSQSSVEVTEPTSEATRSTNCDGPNANFGSVVYSKRRLPSLTAEIIGR